MTRAIAPIATAILHRLCECRISRIKLPLLTLLLTNLAALYYTSQLQENVLDDSDEIINLLSNLMLF
jgi:hypothetical protein